MIPLIWRDGSPYSSQFDDIYFNPQNGLAETRHVFLDGNHLTQRFENVSQFTIAELGFGTGLNCLAAWELFNRVAPSEARLHYISFERFPLPRETLLQSAAQWTALVPLAERLFSSLHAVSPGIYRLNAGQLTLTLVIGDAAEWLPQLSFEADAWFLDGFAPAKNPDMWSEALMLEVDRHTAPAGTAATFTVAGNVRRGLQAAGFEVNKVRGFGTKWEMTVAHKTSSLQEVPRSSRGMTAVVVGGGIAGCSVAYTMARRGVQVTLLETGATLASGASGNPAGALYPRLNKSWSPPMRFYWDAYRFMQAQMPVWRSEGLDIDYRSCGMLKLPIDEGESIKLNRLSDILNLYSEEMRWLGPEQASHLVGMDIPTGGLWMQAAAMVDANLLCRAFIDHSAITTWFNTRTISLERTGGKWLVHTDNGTLLESDIVILANAAAMLTLPQAAHLPLRWDRGQLTSIEAKDCRFMPKCIISHKGYVLPIGSSLLLGATHGRGETDCSLREADQAENIDLTHRYLPGLMKDSVTSSTGRASLRCNTPDHLPLIGEIEPGLYVSTGHGSRGLISAPFAAEIIADQLCGTPISASEAVLAAISPMRFRL